MKSVVVMCLLALVSVSCGDDNTCQPVENAPVNHPPVLQAQRDTSVFIGDTLRLAASATDPDGDALTYYLTPGLRHTSDTCATFIDSLTGQLWFAPSVNDRPERSMILTVVDEHGYGASTLFDVAVSYYLDQFNDSFEPGSFNNVASFSPLGQEFTPQLAGLDFVELYFKTHQTAGELTVNIRRGTIGGEILGGSQTVVIPASFVGVVGFEFDRVSMTQDELYVIEVVQLSGRDIMIAHSGGPNSTYPHGRLIFNGSPNERTDLWFREGAKAPLPVR
jgi:hypothetical protein